MLNNEQKDEECDATGVDSSTRVGYTIITSYIKNLANYKASST